MEPAISIAVECSPMARETGVQSQVESYQRLRKWYLIPPCFILSIIRYVSRVKWSNPGKGLAPSPKFWCNSYWNWSFRVAFDSGRQLYYISYVSNEALTVLSLQIRMEQGAMVIKRYSKHSKSLKSIPQYERHLNVTLSIHLLSGWVSWPSVKDTLSLFQALQTERFYQFKILYQFNIISRP